MKQCDDIGEVVHEEENMRLDEGQKWVNAIVYGVDVLSNYESCIKCSGKVIVDSTKPSLGRCGKCSMLQRVGGMRTWSAKLVIKAGEQVKTLQAFGSNVTDIVADENVMKEALVLAEPFDVSFSSIAM